MDADARVFPQALLSKQPAASLIFEGAARGLFNTAGDSDSFTLALDAGQTLTLELTPIDSAVQGRIALLAPDGQTLIGAADSTAAGQTVLLQTQPVTVAGSYRIDASSLAGIGRYRVRALLNAQIGEGANTTQASAQSLDSSFISLGGAASRGAVRGDLDGSNSQWYSFTLTAGQAATIALAHDAHAQAPNVTLELFGSDNLLLAMGRTDATNVDRYIADFVPGATGSYYARISGATAGAYSLLLTRGAALPFAYLASENISDLSQSGFALGGASTRAIRVAVVSSIPGYPEYDSGYAAMASQLNDDTFFNFTATIVSPSQIDSLSEMSAYDVLVIGDSSTDRDGFAQFAVALNTWVQNGGGLVATGWTILGVKDESTATRQAFSAALPVNLFGGYSYDTDGSVTLTAVSHPVTQGIGAFTTGTYSEFPVRGLRADANSQILATINGHIAVAIATPGSGRSVYLGPIYAGYSSLNTTQLRSGLADRLFEQAVAWANGRAGADRYQVNVNAGDTLVISTTTPGDSSAEPINLLDTKLALYAPDGTKVAENLNGPDGRNARIEYTVPIDASGIYRVEVASENGTKGSYVLSVTGATGFVASAPRVIRQSILDGQIVASPPASIDLTFSEGLRLDTVQAADLVLDGGAVATSLQVIDGSTLRFFINAQDVETAYHYSFAAGVFQGLQGNANAAFDSSFQVEHIGPRVLSQPLGQAVSSPFNQVDFTFSEVLNTASVSASDVASFSGPGGSNLLGQIISVTALGNMVSVRFNEQTTMGQYDLVLGPNISDIAGNAMDQNGNGIKGEGADSYRATITVRSPDLTVTAVTVPSSGAFGQTLDVSWSVKNIGTDTAQQVNWYDRVWLSRDNVLGDGDSELLTVQANANPLAVNGEYTRSAQLLLPVLSRLDTGDYFLIVSTNYYENQAESSKNNNVFVSNPINLVRLNIDLQVQNLAVDHSLNQSGDTITIRWNDFNSGNAAVDAQYYESVYVRNTTTNKILLSKGFYSGKG